MTFKITSKSSGATGPPPPAITPGAYVAQWGALLVYGIYCYNGPNASFPNLDPNIFNPGSTLSVDQWIDAMHSCGMKHIIFTAKQQDGWCAWPTATTNYSVASSSWYSGPNGFDLLRRVVDRCSDRGMVLILYFDIWDQRFEFANPSRTQGQYLSYLQAQLTELLTQYGPIAGVWLDGGFWHFGSAFPWTNPGDPRAFIQGIQPNCVVINNDHLDSFGSSDIIAYEITGNGAVPPGNVGLAEESNTIFSDGNWGWGPGVNSPCRTISAINTEIATAKSRNSTYLLGLPPDVSGTLEPSIVTTLAGLTF